MTLAERLVNCLRASERERRYRLERSSADSVSAVADWLLHYSDEDGMRVWREDAGRRLLAARLLVLRERFAEDWIARGGVGHG